MSEGSWHAGYDPHFSGPFAAHKTWVGGSDRKKVAQLPYTMDFYRIVNTPTIYLNKYYPYVPPSYRQYSASSLGTAPDLSPGNFPAVSSNVSIDALNDAAEKMKQHDFNAAIFGAEAPESIRTIINSALAFKKLISACFSLDISAALRAISGLPGNKSGLKGGRATAEIERAVRARDIGGVVLALRYGWIPLMQDTFEAIKAIEAWSTGPSRQVTFRGKKSEWKWKDIRVSGMSQSCWVLCKSTVRYTIVLREKVSLHRSLGLHDPASVIWEKVPFSFVFDWWIPIGGFLSSFGFFNGLDVTHSKTVFQMMEFDRVPHYAGGAWPPNKTYQFTQNGSYTGRKVKMVRTVGLSPNVPLPSWKSLKQALSPIHLQNAGALVLALFQGQSVPYRRLKTTGKNRKARDARVWQDDRYSRH